MGFSGSGRGGMPPPVGSDCASGASADAAGACVWVRLAAGANKARRSKTVETSRVLMGSSLDRIRAAIEPPV